MKKHGTQFKPQKWSKGDRQAFADGNRNRAQTVPGRRHGGPVASEWDYPEETGQPEDR